MGIDPRRGKQGLYSDTPAIEDLVRVFLLAVLGLADNESRCVERARQPGSILKLSVSANSSNVNSSRIWKSLVS